VNFSFSPLEDCFVTSAVERTKTPPWGLEGGGEAQANRCSLVQADGLDDFLGRKRRKLLTGRATPVRGDPRLSVELVGSQPA